MFDQVKPRPFKKMQSCPLPRATPGASGHIRESDLMLLPSLGWKSRETCCGVMRSGLKGGLTVLTSRACHSAGASMPRCLDAHGKHEQLDVTPPNLAALTVQLITQHARIHERGSRCNSSIRRMRARSASLERPGQVVDRASAHAQQLDLAHEGKLKVMVDSIASLSNPALLSASFKKHSAVSAGQFWRSCSDATSTGSAASVALAASAIPSKASAGCASNPRTHLLIW